MSKPDGRKLAIGPGVFSYRLTNAAKARTIKSFIDAGSSVHSNLGMTVGVILEHCQKNNINFTLMRLNGGYFIERLRGL